MVPMLITLTLVACLSTGFQAGPKPSSMGPDVRRVCLENVDIHLGDSFEEVSERIALSPDPNGPNQNATWVSGRETDFLSTKGPEHALPDGVLRSAVSCTFDGRRRLTEFRLAWQYDGPRTAPARDAVLKALLGDIHDCLKDQLVDLGKDNYKARVDYGTYSQELTFDGGPAGPWRIVYTLSEEP